MNCSARNQATVLRCSLGSLAGRIVSDPVCHHLATELFKGCTSIALLLQVACLAVCGGCDWNWNTLLIIKAVTGCGGRGMPVVLHCLLIQSVRMTALNSSVLSGILWDCLSVLCIFLMSWYRGWAEGKFWLFIGLRGLSLILKPEFREVLFQIQRGFFRPSANFLDSTVQMLAGWAGN